MILEANCGSCNNRYFDQYGGFLQCGAVSIDSKEHISFAESTITESCAYQSPCSRHMLVSDSDDNILASYKRSGACKSAGDDSEFCVQGYRINAVAAYTKPPGCQPSVTDVDITHCYHMV